MADLRSINNTIKNTIEDVGRGLLHYQFPDDFEYYLLALEVTDSENNIVDSFVFPVMPENITEERVSINSINKTQSGVNSIFNPTFAPFPISFGGTFGRKLRLLVNTNSFSNTKANGEEYKNPTFNTRIKTGYGSTKILERIHKLSYSLDKNNKPFRLFYYNFAFNSQYLVEFSNLKLTQTIQGNGLWYYNVSLQAIAPAFLIRGTKKTSMVKLITSDIITKGVGDLLTKSYRDIAISRKKRGA